MVTCKVRQRKESLHVNWNKECGPYNKMKQGVLHPHVY